jgi:hypothetical protein
MTAASVARADPCAPPAAMPAVQAALTAIEATVDPCGEDVQLADLVRRFRRCTAGGVRVCLDPEATRNVTEYGTEHGTTITWNPRLRTELEERCTTDPGRPVLREPVASFLHELAHAVQACEGLDPSDHELEAVRLENVYRRARGLCQRTRYGDVELPPGMLVACEPSHCSCRRPVDVAVRDGALPPTGGIGGRRRAAGDLTRSPSGRP